MRGGMFHLDYLSCFLTVLATILLARKSWIGLIIAIINSLTICAIALRTSQVGFIPANLFCICIYAFSMRSWVKEQGNTKADHPLPQDRGLVADGPRISPAMQHRAATGTSQKAPTVRQRLCTFVKHHVAQVSISLILGGIASVAGAQVASHPERSSSPAAAAPQDQHIQNIVLVHGAWADGSGWRGVYDILVRDGFNVSIVQEPETSFRDDVTAVRRILALQDGPSILVAHSYGGAVITEADTDPSVAGLVYVAAHMPDAGENEGDDGKRFPSDLSRSGVVRKTADGFTYVDPARFREYFAADLSAEQATFMARSQVPNAADNFKAVITTPAWRSKPSWMLVAAKDRTINPDLERWYAARAHSHTVEVAGASHSVYVSHPKKVANVIESAAHAVSK